MSRARHAKRAEGGGLSSKPVWNAGGGQNAAKEAEELRHGGKAVHVHGEGHEAKHRADRPKRRAKGGAVHHEVKHHSMKHHIGEAAEHHRATGGAVPGRAKGGRLRGEGVGADRSPLTTAAKVHPATKGEQPEEGVRDGGM